MSDSRKQKYASSAVKSGTKRNKLLATRITISVFAGLALSFLTVFIPLRGDTYTCNTETGPQRQDARGLPLVYIKRGIQYTGCNAETPSESERFAHQGTFNGVNLILDTLFWSAIVFAAINVRKGVKNV